MPDRQQPDRSDTLTAVIFDVDGVLVASPHERAWQEVLSAMMRGPWQAIAAATSYALERFTTAVYQVHVSGKPRLSGARAVLEYFGVPDAERRAVEYAERKQRRIEELIDAGVFVAFAEGGRGLVPGGGRRPGRDVAGRGCGRCAGGGPARNRTAGSRSATPGQHEEISAW